MASTLSSTPSHSGRRFLPLSLSASYLTAAVSRALSKVLSCARPAAEDSEPPPPSARHGAGAPSSRRASMCFLQQEDEEPRRPAGFMESCREARPCPNGCRRPLSFSSTEEGDAAPRIASSLCATCRLEEISSPEFDDAAIHGDIWPSRGKQGGAMDGSRGGGSAKPSAVSMAVAEEFERVWERATKDPNSADNLALTRLHMWVLQQSEGLLGKSHAYSQ